MGAIKTVERSGKRALMRAVGAFLRAPRLSREQVRAMDVRRVLVIRQHNQMGDMLLAIPALRAIKETHPESSLHVVSSTLNRGVMKICPYVDRVHTYDKRNIFSHAGLVSRLRRERFDVVIVLHTVSFSFTSLALAVLSGARLRIGSTSRSVGESLTGSYLSLTLPLPDEDEIASAGMNEAEHNLYPLAAIGITTDDIGPEITPGAASRSWAAEFAAEAWQRDTVRLAVHPGAGKSENIWPPERFAAVVNNIAEKRPVSLVLVEGPRDRETVSAFTAACSTPATVVRERSIGDVAALLQLADLTICNDTGVMHVAAAAGARTLAVFGPTDPVRWAPRHDCLSIVRSDDGRLLSLDPARVAAKAMDALGSS